MVISNLNKKINLSVVLATFNEEANLAKCLTAINDIAQEIIVVDGTSTDKTVKIALKYKARVITTTNKPNFHINKQMAIAAARGKWILQLDADEVVDEELKAEILKVLKHTDEYNGYWLKRKNYFLGTFLTKGGQYPDPLIRFFKNGKGKLPQISVHEQIEIEGKVGKLEGHLLHYNAPTFKRYLLNANRYTDLTALVLKHNNVKLNRYNDFQYLFIKPVNTFLNIYFRHSGFIDGFPGFVFALFSGLHFALAYMKLGDIYAGRD